MDPTKLASNLTSSYLTLPSTLIPLQLFLRPPSTTLFPFLYSYASFPFGKGDSSVCANCSLCGAEATLPFSAGPVCSSYSAKTCAIPQALRWFRQYQKVCHFSSHPFLSDCDFVLSSVFPFTLNYLEDLKETVSFLFPYSQATMNPRTLISLG